ncbi:hypothetical protein SRHO_G00096550 [Serrasalmus rhombeus]
MRTLIFLIVLCFSLTNASEHGDKAVLRQIISDLEKVSTSFNSTPPTIKMAQCKCNLQAMNILKNLLQNRTQDGESEEDETRAIRIMWNIETLDLSKEESKTCLVERRKRKTNPASGPMLKHYLQHVREVFKKKCPLKDTA